MKGRTGEQQTVFRLSGYWLAVLILSQPIFACLVCVLLSLIYNFEASTATHCRVRNYLPSISSAIGGFTPQRYIWRVCISLHCAPRLMIAVCYFNYYKSFTVKSKRGLYDILVWINMLLNLAENGSLLLLTCVSSTENYSIHENSFIAFMIFSEIYMAITLRLYTWSKESHTMTARERHSYRYKLTFFLMNLAACVCAIYFFYRHNTYCEPGVYTYFAMCEYSVVFTNILFHATAVFEFGHGAVMFKVPTLEFDHKD